jgi:hypothetical protein
MSHRIRTFLIAFALSGALASAGCLSNTGNPPAPGGEPSASPGDTNPATGGTETGNSGEPIALRVVGYQSSLLAEPAASSILVGGLTVDTAKIVLDRIRFRPLSVCQLNAEDEGATDVRVDGPFVIDLLQPAPLNGLEEVSIPSGVYCRIEMVLSKFENLANPSDLMSGKSVLVTGKRADNVPFEMKTEVDESFKLENVETGFRIDSDSSTVDRIFFIAFDLDHWFDGADLNDPGVEISKDAGGNPVILINDKSNEGLQEAIKQDIQFSSDLFKDSDGDERLDAEEQGEPLAEGMPVL